MIAYLSHIIIIGLGPTITNARECLCISNNNVHLTLDSTRPQATSDGYLRAKIKQRLIPHAQRGRASHEIPFTRSPTKCDMLPTNILLLVHRLRRWPNTKACSCLWGSEPVFAAVHISLSCS